MSIDMVQIIMSYCDDSDPMRQWETCEYFNPTQPGVSDHERDLGGGGGLKVTPPINFRLRQSK